MIHRLFSDSPRFKNLRFHEGLNILLAEKGVDASDKQTRNRAGKSSLLEVIHFLLGSNCDKDSIFRNNALVEATFGMEFELGNRLVRVERSGSRPTPVVVEGDTTEWPVAPMEKDGALLLKHDDWKTVLAARMFGLDESPLAWSPSFRSLVGYFVRRERKGGMQSPMMQAAQQQLVDQQVNVSFLLGLDWLVAREWQGIRDREKSLDQLKKGMSKGVFGAIVGSASSLKSELILAQDRVRRLKLTIGSFRVVEEYHALELEATTLTKHLAELADDNLLDRRYLSELETTVVEEVPPEPTDLEQLYREAGVVLPNVVRKRFEEVRAFHDSVVRNRRAYLHSEIEAAKQRISERDQEKGRVDSRRSEVLEVLRSAGALDQFVALQRELTKAETVEQDLLSRYSAAEALESGGLKLKVERAQLLDRLRRELDEQGEAIRDAILTFRDISSQLYEDEQVGTLTIATTENGPVFDPHMPGEKSKGVNNMRIFCFDMMITLLSIKRGKSPGFVVHDSHLFDGVDERQVGKALAVGAVLAKQHGFQYIVTMNTDAIPREVPAGFRVEDHALEQRLTDATADGGLFGIRFD